MGGFVFRKNKEGGEGRRGRGMPEVLGIRSAYRGNTLPEVRRSQRLNLSQTNIRPPEVEIDKGFGKRELGVRVAKFWKVRGKDYIISYNIIFSIPESFFLSPMKFKNMWL